MIKAIEDAGGKPKYTEYPEVGHGSWRATYKNDEVFDWMYSQKR
jgi:predicted peptidase